MATTTAMAGMTATAVGEQFSIKAEGYRGPLFCQEVRPLNRSWVATCPRCKTHRRVEAGDTAAILNGAPLLVCCGATVPAKLAKGTANDTKCGAKCTGSKGHVCDCSCGGKNHGRDA